MDERNVDVGPRDVHEKRLLRCRCVLHKIDRKVRVAKGDRHCRPAPRSFDISRLLDDVAVVKERKRVVPRVAGPWVARRVVPLRGRRRSFLRVPRASVCAPVEAARIWRSHRRIGAAVVVRLRQSEEAIVAVVQRVEPLLHAHVPLPYRRRRVALRLGKFSDGDLCQRQPAERSGAEVRRHTGARAHPSRLQLRP